MTEDTNRNVAPGPSPREVTDERGRTLSVPPNWSLLEPGDAAATRRVKKAGPHWVMAEKKGRRTFGRGVWAPTTTIETVLAELETERADPAYQRKLDRGRQRRAAEQVAYVDEFTREVAAFLSFAPRYLDLEAAMARAIAEHATPVGSGTVARTKRISVERRAEAATIAWMRHQTTAYDSMTIERVKGRRRQVRAQLAERSRELLGVYRRGEHVDADRCLLRRAVGAGTGRT